MFFFKPYSAFVLGLVEWEKWLPTVSQATKRGPASAPRREISVVSPVVAWTPQGTEGQQVMSTPQVPCCVLAKKQSEPWPGGSVG